MKSEFNPNSCNTTIICNFYPELQLHDKINCKADMLPSLACHTQPGIYRFLKNKYETKNSIGEFRHYLRNLHLKQGFKFSKKIHKKFKF